MRSSRRQFLTASAGALVSTTAAAVPAIAAAATAPNLHPRSLAPEFTRDAASGALSVNPAQQVSYTACMGCTTMCGVRVRLDRKSGQVLRVAGNPYSPLSTATPVPYKASIRESFAALARDPNAVIATACGRGNAVAEQMASPFRVLTPLKRVGPRGSGRWEPVPFEQVVREVVDGGDLFGDGPVQGLRALRDLRTPIDAAQPQLGPRVNQVALLSSFNDGREAFARRFMQSAYGTINFVGHGSYCGGSYRSGSGAMFGDLKGMPHAKPDFANAEFVIFVGTAPGNAGNPFKRQANQVAQARSGRGGFAYVVVDPVLTHASSAAAGARDRWLPIRPATDGALAMGMMRWMFEQGRIDERYLAQPSAKAADAAGEASWSNATFLVVVEPGHAREGRFLRASDLGAPLPDADRHGDKDAFVVVDEATGTPSPHTEAKGPAKLWYAGKVDVAGTPVAVTTSLALLKAEAMRRTPDDYAAACGIPAERIAALAREFTSHGKKAAVNVHGGTMAGNGFYSAYALVMLNTLVGNLNVRGGTLVNGGGFPDAGPGPRYDLANFDGAVKPSGTPLGRNVPYEKSAEFARRKAAGTPYPAQAPWFPNAPQLATEWLTSPLDGYPYGLKALILWSSNPVYGVPGLRRQAEAALRDTAKLPLIVAVDPFINESSAFADYIVPDSLMYESYGYGAAWGGVPTKATTARWPVVVPKAAKLPDGTPIGMESFFIALAQAMQLPGFGADAIADRDGRRHALRTPEDWYLRAGANVAFGGKEPVPDASDEDLLLSGLDRLRPQLESTLRPDEWRKAAYVLSRGGRYQPVGETFRADRPQQATNAYAAPMQVYNETLAASRSSVTGRRFAGTPTWLPAAFADGTPMRERYPERDWPLQLVSFKSPLQNSYSIGAAKLRRLHPENDVRLHPADARRYSLADGDLVVVTTPGGSMRARVQVADGVVPGVIAVEHGYGHRELGARARTRSARSGSRRFPDSRPASTSTTSGSPIRPAAAVPSGPIR